MSNYRVGVFALVGVFSLFISASAIAPVFAQSNQSGAGNDGTRGMVTLSFDDSWESQYANALPLLTEYEIPATFYITTDTMDPEKYSGFMTWGQVWDLHKKGHEVGSHTINHADLTAISEEEAREELIASKEELENTIGAPVTSFAYPFGAYDEDVVEWVEEAGYTTARTVNGSTNAQDAKPYLLTSISPKNSTPLQTLQEAIEYAVETDTWLIISFHEINDSGNEYSHSPEYLEDVIEYLKETDVSVVTVREGWSRLHEDIASVPTPEAPESSAPRKEEGMNLELFLTVDLENNDEEEEEPENQGNTGAPEDSDQEPGTENSGANQHGTDEQNEDQEDAEEVYDKDTTESSLLPRSLPVIDSLQKGIGLNIGL